MVKVIAGLSATVFSILMAPVILAIVYPTGFQPDAACVSNARQISSALDQYIQDYDERLPPMQSSAIFQTALSPYAAQNPKVFTCPDTGEGYVPNASLSYEALATFYSTHDTETFQDVQGHFRNGLKTVAFLDGHIERGGVVQENGDANTQCIDNVKQLALGIEIYVQDYDEKLPEMNTPAHFQTELYPYTKNPSLFSCPVTSQPYSPNSALSYQSLASFADASTVPTVQDSQKHPDGAVTIGYLDGHVTNTDVKHTASDLSNIKQIALAAIFYEPDNNEALPPLDTYADFEAALMPYVKNLAIFTCPDTGLPYQINASLNGDNLSTVDPSTWIVRDAAINNDGSFNTGHVGGYVDSADYYLPSQLNVDSSGKPSLAWFRSAGINPTINIWDLTSTGTSSSTFSYAYDRLAGNPIIPPISVTPVSSDSRVMFWSSTDPTSLLPLRVTITDKTGAVASTTLDGPYDGWAPVLAADGGFAVSRLLMRHYDGACALWYVQADGTYGGNIPLSPNEGENPLSMAEGRDGTVHILFSQKNGLYRLWTISNKNAITGQESFGVASGQSIVHVATGPDNLVRLLVNDGNGNAEIWKLNSSGVVTATTLLSESSVWTPSQVGVDSSGDYLVLWKAVGGTAKITRVTPAGTVLYDQTYTPFM